MMSKRIEALERVAEEARPLFILFQDQAPDIVIPNSMMGKFVLHGGRYIFKSDYDDDNTPLLTYRPEGIPESVLREAWKAAREDFFRCVNDDKSNDDLDVESAGQYDDDQVSEMGRVSLIWKYGDNEESKRNIPLIAHLAKKEQVVFLSGRFNKSEESFTVFKIHSYSGAKAWHISHKNVLKIVNAIKKQTINAETFL